MGIDIRKNALGYTLKIYALFCVYDITQFKKLKKESEDTHPKIYGCVDPVNFLLAAEMKHPESR